MYRYVRFDEIEKNKWNGTVHYAPNGNTMGYYWYLKSILKEWDAIIEDDYETVMPIIRRPLYQKEYELIPELGPYSVNYLSPSRVEALFAEAEPYHHGTYYPINREMADGYLDSYTINRHPFYLLETKNPYHDLLAAYHKEAQDIINSHTMNSYQILSGLKPEEIVRIGSIPNHLQQALMRILYNAMHRGIGFTSAIKDTHTDEYLAASIFVVSHNIIHEIYDYTRNGAARMVLLDLLIRNNGGKPITLSIRPTDNVAEQLGFRQMNYRYLKIKNTWWIDLKVKLGVKY